MAAIYLPENKLHPFVTQTQNEMHLKGKGSATGTMEIVLGKEKCRDECSTGSNNQVYRGAKTQNFPDSNFFRAKKFWKKRAKPFLAKT